jgi:hypothetical protein
VEAYLQVGGETIMAVIPPALDEGEGIVEVEEQWQGWWMEWKRQYYDYDQRRSEGDGSSLQRRAYRR